MRCLAYIFPGIGYTTEKPLLRGSIAIAEDLGYDIRPIRYGGFPAGVKGDEAKMRACYEIALAQAREQLSGDAFDDCEDVLFIGKSIGTLVAAALAAGRPDRERIRFVLYTPLEETFAFPLASAVAFASTADPWVGAEESRIPALCRERGIPCRSIPGANHSLLTGDEATDTRNLTLVLRETERFLLSRDEEARRRRIERHEALLNEAAQLLSGAELTEKERVVLREDTSALAAYYGSAAWKRDYAADEHGLLPGDLKRGVLSEDGIDTLLEQYREFTADESASKE